MNWLTFFINLSFIAIILVVIIAFKTFSLRQQLFRLRFQTKKLNQTNHELEELLQQPETFYYIHDFAGKIEYLSPGIEDCLGLNPKLLVGQRFQTIMDDQKMQGWNSYIQKVFQNSSTEGIFTLVDKEGNAIQFSYFGTSVYQDGVIIRVKGSARRVGVQPFPKNKLAQPSKIPESVIRNNSGMIHDLKNIFSAILGFSDIIRTEKPPLKELESYNVEISDASRRGIDLVGKLLRNLNDPVPELDRKKQRPEKDTKSPAKVIKGKGQILYVDDEQALLRMYSKFLERLGYRVKGFTSGVKAIQYLQQDKEDIELVLLDWMMPEISGSELLRKIREVRKDTPVIILSGKKISEPPSEKVFAVLEKPVDPVKMSEIVSNAILSV